MAIHEIGIIMNGVTGRMGTNQHLIRSILAIRDQGGVTLPNGDAIMPDPILVGRQEHKVKALAEKHGVARWSTDLDACLADGHNIVYFDSQTTQLRAASIKKAIAAGKHIYCEKPTADSLAESLELARIARKAGVKNGVVQDKLFLPGLLKLKRLVDSGFFGRILSVRMEFGYWVFEGDWQTGQRPSWNYRAEDGGGIIVDMFAHWRYVLDNLFGEVRSVSCLGMTHIPERVDEQGKPYKATADDAAYATFLLDGDIVVQANSSWTVRVNREDLLTIQVDGTEGSAVAGLRDCKVQHRVNTPKPVWNPDIPNPHKFLEQWKEVPDNQLFDNGFKVQWELFLKHIVTDSPFPWDLLEGAKGTQLAELGLQSWKERRWIDVPELTL
ncbi:Gfo/Idh/MocA family protein [Paenibacillus ginsengihumi]|uniref:Gfo/Idh/MocA family protein n=1 Tax=Paenibacillus ginsengihumi TaxID=431596 RepID=UPI00037F949E|nr:Gfo/Idh/MocA family oxidoreductase [Paenibacillus ginsengihumi]